MTDGAVLPVGDWVEKVARERGDAAAIFGIDRPPLSYAQFAEQVRTIGAQLRACGVRPADVVLIALPDGPEALVTIVAVSSVAGAFPLGVNENIERYRQLLDALPVSAVIASERVLTRLAPSLAQRGIASGRVAFTEGEPAGMFRLEIAGSARPALANDAPRPQLEDVAILIATAGTTAAPKIVASSHASIYASITHCADWLKLTTADRSLCVMPFAHLHAIVRSTLPALIAGGQVMATPGFDTSRVLSWIDTYRPTFITAAPAIYRRMTQVIREANWVAKEQSLRLLVTGSDRTDAGTITDASKSLNAPMIQFYGLSEVAPLVATSTVGDTALAKGAAGRINPAWSAVAMSGDCTPLPPGTEGEIALKGGHINGLAGSGAPSQRFSADGYLLTGDLGRVDADGTLFVTGRVDDRIHRGGEKIDPKSVEEVLLAHPMVKEAAVFPIADATLGQRVGAVVVTRMPVPSVAALQAFAAERLFAHMVPETIVLAPALPVNAAGKVPRTNLATALGLAGEVAKRAATATSNASDVESQLHEIFARHLKRADIDREARFSQIGGDSFAAIEVLLEIEDTFARSIPPATFNANDSIAALAGLITGRSEAEANLKLVAINENGRFPPLFIPYGPEGLVGFSGAIGEALGPEQPIYTFHAPNRDQVEPESMEEKATAMIEMILAVQPSGPYYVAGYSFGAHVAFEIAQQLVARGAAVAFLGVIDDSADLGRRWFGIERTRTPKLTTSAANMWALHRYVPKPYPGKIALFRAAEPVEAYQSDPEAGWGHLAQGGVTAFDVPGEHDIMVTTRGFRWGALLSIALAKARHTAGAARPAKAKPAPDVRHALAARIACKLGDRKTEIAEYKKAMAIAPQPLWVQRNLAEALFEDGHIDDGIAISLAANAVDPWPYFSLVQLANRLAKLNRPKEIVSLYEQGKALLANDTDTLRHFAHLCRLAGRLDEAEAAVRQAIVLDGRSAFAHNHASDLRAYLSDILAATRRLPEAIAYAAEAAELDPRSLEKALRAGRLCAEVARYAEARIWFTKALAIAPHSAAVTTALWSLPRSA